MRKIWSIAMGIILSGLTFIGIRQLVNANHSKEGTPKKSNLASMAFLFIIVVLIMMLAFSMEIKIFLTNLLSE